MGPDLLLQILGEFMRWLNEILKSLMVFLGILGDVGTLFFKSPKDRGFLMFSRGIKREHWK